MTPRRATLAHADYAALAAFRYELRKFLRFSKDFLARRSRLTTEQYEAMLAVKAHSPGERLTIGELSERLQVKHHTTVSLIDGLVARGLLARKRATSDRRQVFVQLTARGQAILEDAAAVHRAEIQGRSPAIVKALRRVQKR